MHHQKRSVLSLASVALVVAVSLPVFAFPDGPEPEFTGGKGFADCSSCHFAGPPKSDASGIQLHGLAEQMVPGELYRFTVEVNDPEQRVGGFQLAIRDLTTGESVGELKHGDGLRIFAYKGVDFLSHSEPQNSQQQGQVQRVYWEFEWRAEPAEELEFSVAAVAADGDDSSLGDNVYTFSRIIRAD